MRQQCCRTVDCFKELLSDSSDSSDNSDDSEDSEDSEDWTAIKAVRQQGPHRLL